MTRCRLVGWVGVAWLLGSGAVLRAQEREIDILERADATLQVVEARSSSMNWLPYTRFMRAQLRQAQGIAIFPGMFRAAAGIGGRHGRGVLLIRQPDGSWGPPIFLRLSGANVGIQLGVARSDLVLVLRTRDSLESLLQGRRIVDLDNMLAVGSHGVEHVFGTDAGLKTCVLSTSSPSRGVYAGWSAEGSRLRIDAAATAAYARYERSGAGMPSPSSRLRMRLARL